MPDELHTAKEALKAFVRSLARADAIDEYHPSPEDMLLDFLRLVEERMGRFE
jgi:hypothetical protein